MKVQAKATTMVVNLQCGKCGEDLVNHENGSFDHVVGLNLSEFVACNYCEATNRLPKTARIG